MSASVTVSSLISSSATGSDRWIGFVDLLAGRAAALEPPVAVAVETAMDDVLLVALDAAELLGDGTLAVLADLRVDLGVEVDHGRHLPSSRAGQSRGSSSIRNVLTAIQITEARDRNVLTPWTSWRHEFFKPMRTLHEADRGGYTFAPDVGLHEDVHELDFSLRYPNIIVTRNVSPETVCCECHESDDVTGLGYAICDERREAFSAGLYRMSII